MGLHEELPTNNNPGDELFRQKRYNLKFVHDMEKWLIVLAFDR